MAEKLFADVLQELFDNRRTGALYVSVVETSEDLLRIYFRAGAIYHIRYGSAAGKDCLDILEYYNLNSATYFESIASPGNASSPDLPETRAIIEKIRSIRKTVRTK